MRKSVQLQPMTAITATGGTNAVDIRGYTRNLEAMLMTLKTAGTNPTLASKLQSSPPAVSGYGFAGTTTPADNKIQSAGITKQDAAWTQSGAASIQTVSLSLKKSGTIAAGKLVTVAIFADSAGAPTGSALGSATIDIDSLITTSYDLVTATFTTPVDVADATLYHLVVTADYTASNSNLVLWQSGVVASGGNQSTYTPSSWTAVDTVSLLVQMGQLVFADVTSGAYTGATTAATRQSLNLIAESLQAWLRLYHTIGGTSTPTYSVGANIIVESRTS